MTYKPEDMMWALLSGAAFLLSLAVPVYMYLHIQNAEAYIAEVSGQLARAAQDERSQDLTKEVLQKTEGERARLDALVLKPDGAADFIDAVETEAKIAGVRLDVGNVSSSPKEGSFNELTLSLKAEGSFAGLSRFLKLLETLPYASEVHSVTFDIDDGKASSWTVVASVGVAQYKTP